MPALYLVLLVTQTAIDFLQEIILFCKKVFCTIHSYL